MLRQGLCIAAVALAIATCGRGRTSRSPSYESALIEDVPHVRQRPDFCGEACAEMVLSKLGRDIDQNDVYDVSGLDPGNGRGLWAAELGPALEAIGFEVGDVWYQVKDEKDVEEQFASLHRDLARSIPSIVCMHYSDLLSSPEHFRLVLGYDALTDEVIYHEPAEDDGAYVRMTRERFLELWPLGSGDRRTVIRMRLEPREIRDVTAGEGLTNADYVQHVIALGDVVGPGLTIVVLKPFVVIGDESAAAVREHARTTVKWTVEYLKRDFFDEDPDRILDIWLFGDEASYTKHAWDLFGDVPTTPFGYYSDEHDALIMNISTGGGTLVHEIVHPYMEANFPECPPWLNEGLGSLYEACSDEGGYLHGLVNWRLPGLQESISAGEVPTFEELMAMDEETFYGEGSGTHYAQARYLCQYLEEQSLLRRFYRDFHAYHEEDPTGYETLKAVLEEKDMKAFQKRWEEWVLGLEFG